ncbi:RcnB family protein [Sphingobium yanoikuyae]|uniref:RcnB family protein n=1 Tax=Sphingobium yanoikuyae TaxID=13690 RepID=UPI00241FB2EC|nr:RcnB family protein [Sphingobium yanoikuyae]
MKKAVLYLSIALIVVPDIAIAQQGSRPPSGGGARPSPSTRPAPAPSRPGGSTQPSRPSGPSTPPSRPGGSNNQPSRPGTSQPSRPGGSPNQPNRPGGPSTQPSRPGGPSVQPPRPGNPGQPHRPGAGRPPNFRPIHGPAYRYPRGYSYRRWTVGLFLPAIFFSTAYYYDDYWRMGLGAPPYGYRWIRYGPDMLLVEVRSRRVVDVVYGAFY